MSTPVPDWLQLLVQSGGRIGENFVRLPFAGYEPYVPAFAPTYFGPDAFEVAFFRTDGSFAVCVLERRGARARRQRDVGRSLSIPVASIPTNESELSNTVWYAFNSLFDTGFFRDVAT